MLKHEKFFLPLVVLFLQLYCVGLSPFACKNSCSIDFGSLNESDLSILQKSILYKPNITCLTFNQELSR